MNKKITSTVLIFTILFQYIALAGTPNLRDTIRSEIEKQYEQETPGVKPSFADEILSDSEKNVKENVVEMLTDFKMGVVNGYKLARDGNGTVVVLGMKDAWKFLLKYGKAAGIHFKDSVWLMPEKAKGTKEDFQKAANESWELMKKQASHSADKWKDFSKDVAGKDGDWDETLNAYKDITDWAGRNYKEDAKDFVRGAKQGFRHSLDWSKAVLDLASAEVKDAELDFKSDTKYMWDQTKENTKDVGKFFWEQTKDSIRSVNDWSEKTWDWTWDTTEKVWKGTDRAGQSVWNKYTTEADKLLSWLNKNTLKPLLKQMPETEKDFWKWNWKKGYTHGVKEGFQEARKSWKFNDGLIGTVWAIAGIGKFTLHVLLLEPTVAPFIFAYGVAATPALALTGYPSVGALYGLGGVMAGATYATGGVLTGTTAVGGTAASVAAGGLGVVRTAATVGVGIPATALTGVGMGAATVGVGAFHGLRIFGTEAAALVGTTGAFTAGISEVVGRTVWNGAQMVGTTAVTGAGYGVVTAYEATKIAFRASYAAGVTVFDNAIITPVGLVMNFAQALASGAVRLTEDPVLGVLNAFAAGGIFLGSVVTSTGAFTYEALKGTFMGLADGVQVVYYSGKWIFGVAAKGIEFVVALVDPSDRRKWRKFREAKEIPQIFEEIKLNSTPEMARRFGKIIRTRVHWWGKDIKGYTRAFISKNEKTGERWFFKREVDLKTCEVLYHASNRDPVVRAFLQLISEKPWEATYHTGLYNRVCEREKVSK